MIERSDYQVYGYGYVNEYPYKYMIISLHLGLMTLDSLANISRQEQFFKTVVEREYEAGKWI